jgi:hypothetical protein
MSAASVETRVHTATETDAVIVAATAVGAETESIASAIGRRKEPEIDSGTTRQSSRRQERWSQHISIRVRCWYGQDDGPPAKEPEKPNFGNSGLLARETNLVKGVQIKYNEPPEARKPLKNWRLYVFKGTEQIGAWSDPSWAHHSDLIHIYKQSAYLVGRDTVVSSSSRTNRFKVDM